MMTQNNNEIENFIKLSESKLFNLAKVLIAVAFFLGGWAASLQIDLLENKKINYKQDLKIENLEKKSVDIQLLIATDMPTIKSMLQDIQKDIDEIKKDQKAK